MLKVNAVGCDFTPECDYCPWTFNAMDPSARYTIFCDRQIRPNLHTKVNGRKYAWLVESYAVIQSVVEDVKRNLNTFLEQYDFIFTHHRELLTISPRCKFVHTGMWVKEVRVRPKTRLVSMIASAKNWCPGHKYRLGWAEKLRNSLDLFGSYNNNSIPKKELGLCDYMFSVTIENCSSNMYFSEKILDCFATGTIPIYWGAPDIGRYFNINGIILLTDDFDINQLSEELYYSKLDFVKENAERARFYEGSLPNFVMRYLPDTGLGLTPPVPSDYEYM